MCGFTLYSTYFITKFSEFKMTNKEVIELKKATALNDLRKLFNPRTEHSFTYYEGQGSRMEQMGYKAERIIETLEKELKDLKK